MSASAHQQKHEEERPCWPAFHFHSVSLIFLLICGRYRHCVWPIWYMLWPMWIVADMVCGRYRRFPNCALQQLHNFVTSCVKATGEPFERSQ